MDFLEQLLKALADKNRLRILGLLTHKDYCVCELAYVLKITQPSVSKHLKKMKLAGLIDSRQEGLWTTYYLVDFKKVDETKMLHSLLNLLSKNPQVLKDIRLAKTITRDELCCNS